MKNSPVLVCLILIPLAACAPAIDQSESESTRVSTGRNNFAFSSNLEDGLSVSVNGDNVTTWTAECTRNTTKLSEVDESLRNLIESARNQPTNSRNSYTTSARINGIRIETVSNSYGFNGNYESGTFPVRRQSNSSFVAITVVNHLFGFVRKSGRVELKPSKCLTDGEWNLVESSRDQFQSQLQDGMRRGMEDFQRNMLEMQRNLNEQFKSNTPMNFGNLFGNNFPFGSNGNPFVPFSDNYNPFQARFPYGINSHTLDK